MKFYNTIHDRKILELNQLYIGMVIILASNSQEKFGTFPLKLKEQKGINYIRLYMYMFVIIFQKLKYFHKGKRE